MTEKGWAKGGMLSPALAATGDSQNAEWGMDQLTV